MKDLRDKHVTSLDVRLRLSKELTELLTRKEDERFIDSTCEGVASFLNNDKTEQSTRLLTLPVGITGVTFENGVITDIQYSYRSIFPANTAPCK